MSSPQWRKIWRQYHSAGNADSPSEAAPPSSALANLGRDTCPAAPGMERTMTIELVHCPALPDHDVTPIELQRWEDDGGAVAPESRPRRHRSLHAHYPSTERRWSAQGDVKTAA